MNCAEAFAHVHNPDRLAALQAVAMLDSPTEESFDRLTWLATRFINAPVALVSLIDADRQFFKSCRGLPEPWQSRRETPLSHSFCQYNYKAGEPLLIEDAREHPLLKESLAIRDLKVIAYLGIPLVTSDGYVLGAFCVIDTKPRQWSAEEVRIVKDLALSVMTEIALRAEVVARSRAEEELRWQHEALREAYQQLGKESDERIRALEELRQRDQMLIQQSRLAAMGEMISNIAHQWRQPLNLLALLAQELPVIQKTGRPTDGFVEEHVQKMMKAIRHMSKTIDDFRNFFMPDKERVDFSVTETIEKALALMDLSVNGEQIRTAVTANAVTRVHGFPNEYAQVLLNILINARDAFAARQVPEPQIRIEVDRDEAGRSVVTITDNAGGIPEGIIQNVFEPYFTTKGPKGTGIGLYMSKMIIERNMGGSLTVRNVGGGASFRIAV